MASDIITIAEFFPNQKADIYFFKSLLEAEGIRCIVVGDLDAPTISNVLLQVAAADEDRARQLLGTEAK